MAATNETGLVKAIVKAVIAEYPDAWISKIHGDPYQTVGIPDLLACLNGRLVGMEVKHPKPGETVEHARGRATPMQLRQLELIRCAGGFGAVVISVDESLRLCRQAMEYRDDVDPQGSAADLVQPEGAGQEPD